MAKKMFIHKIHLILLACMISFISCSSDENIMQEKPVETVTILIATPQSVGTRAVGDPGEAVQEGEDWDEMAVIFGYTELEGAPTSSTSLPVIVETLTKQAFENLPVYSGTTYRQLRLNIPKGKVHIYGVTYSSDAANSPKAAIQGCTTDVAVKALIISNDYASGDERQTEKFLSVATGYYQDDQSVSGGLAEYEISKDADNGELKPIPSMRLTRLATKIDIQWDAQDAYTQGYTDVKVEGFTFYNTNTPEEPGTEAGKGKGCLFPELYPATGTETFAGKSEFLNTSAVSKRNGRVYHYVFPSNKRPQVKFNLSATKDGNTQTPAYIFEFANPIQKSTWYKVNTTIRGVTGNTTITLGTN